MRVLNIFLSISIIAVQAFSQSQPPVSKSTSIAGTRVNLVPPAGFTPSSQFPGYELESLGSSIMVIEFPAPFSDVSLASSNPGALKEKGMTFVSREEVKVNGQTSALVKVKQSAGGTDYVKWIVTFGNEKEAVLIVATFPQTHEHEVSGKLRASLLTASWDGDKSVPPTEVLKFEFSEKGDLKLATRMTNTLVFTRGGIFPSKDIDDPIFVVGQSLRKVDSSDLEAFAESRIHQTTSVTAIEIDQSESVEIDGLIGREILAKARDSASGQPMVVYQTLLFERGSYYLMLGLISEKLSHNYLPLFKELARSFKRKNQ